MPKHEIEQAKKNLKDYLESNLVIWSHGKNWTKKQYGLKKKLKYSICYLYSQISPAFMDENSIEEGGAAQSSNLMILRHPLFDSVQSICSKRNFLAKFF